ncbi:MAG: DNA polymerase III subunit [Actinomycetota bacterium]
MNPPVLDLVPGQDAAMTFLRGAAERPHHAYVFAGPEGSGKQLGARAFAAALLCPDGGCGTCRACRLALDDRHPNSFLVEPEGRDIHVDTVRDEIWHPAYRTPPEPGRKLFVIREADRLNPAAADVLLKVLEEPPPACVFLLMSARPHELPETVLSRCHVVTFSPLAEDLVVETLAADGTERSLATLAARLAGGNVGRARRMARADGLGFRDVAREALDRASTGPPGAIAAADLVLKAAERRRTDMKEELAVELEPFLDDKGRPEAAYRGAIKRLETRHHRRLRREERDFVDRVLLAISAILRDRIADRVGAGPDALLNVDLAPDGESIVGAAGGLAAVEEARAALAEDLNLNQRLVIEQAFLQLGAPVRVA